MAHRTAIARMMQAYWRMTRSLTLGAQGCILDGEGRVLLIRHTYRPGWHFPGGGVERGEATLTALTRELDEEAGVELTGPPRLFGIYTNFRVFPGDHIALFVVREFVQPVAPVPTREIAEHGFFARDRLPEGTITPVRSRLAEILDGKAVSATW
ncbi:MAG: NUDIX domain-containing protein [Hyphomicrobiaceae bacterium]|nr:NUDIX domain-containing protein [Hyphomicrobiaceae bacterium]